MLQRKIIVQIIRYQHRALNLKQKKNYDVKNFMTVCDNKKSLRQQQQTNDKTPTCMAHMLVVILVVIYASFKTKGFKRKMLSGFRTEEK